LKDFEFWIVNFGLFSADDADFRRELCLNKWSGKGGHCHKGNDIRNAIIPLQKVPSF